MSVVYNNLTEKIGFIINDYFSGKDNSVKLKQRARKDLHMFIAKEFHVLNYAVASRDVYKQVCMLAISKKTSCPQSVLMLVETRRSGKLRRNHA